MNILSYTENPEVLDLIAQLRSQYEALPGGLQVSNIRDAAGRQYVDLVMEGGGTLGVALLGYLYVLEQMDIRFLQIAGTSAGSIVAMLLAAAGPIEQRKCEWLIDKVASKDFYDFVDGGEEVEAFVDAMFDSDAKKGKKAVLTVKVLQNLKDHFGLNPGAEFLRWMTDLLAECSVHNLQDLQHIRGQVPDRINCPATRWERISVVTADVTTGTKVAFPDAAALYWANPAMANPAEFVRASMSVPVFFYPFQTLNIPHGTGAGDRWATLANYHGPIPPSAYFVDGGSMSNFPLSLLRPEGPQEDAPLFGIKIGADRDSYNACENFGAFAGAMLGSMMSFYDNDFLVQHPELQKGIGVIDTGEYNWLDFSINEAGKIDLFVRGARAAKDFLKNWPGRMVNGQVMV